MPWIQSASKIRRGILVALTDAPDDAIMEETIIYTQLRVPGEYEPRVLISNWATDGVWDRLLARDQQEHAEASSPAREAALEVRVPGLWAWAQARDRTRASVLLVSRMANALCLDNPGGIMETWCPAQKPQKTDWCWTCQARDSEASHADG